jgi:hypothetical protein
LGGQGKHMGAGSDLRRQPEGDRQLARVFEVTETRERLDRRTSASA